MARISYIDEMNQRGQIDLDAVRPGDLVKFNVEYEHEDPPIHVIEGTIAEVLQESDQLPAVAVRVHGMTETKDGFETGEKSIAVKPELLILLVDSRDERLGSTRIIQSGFSRGQRFPLNADNVYDTDKKHVMPDTYKIDGFHADGSIELVGESRQKRYRFNPGDLRTVTARCNAVRLAGMDVGLWEIVKTGISGISGGRFISKAKAVATLSAWARELTQGGTQHDAQVVSSVNAAIDAIESMTDELWAVELADHLR